MKRSTNREQMMMELAQSQRGRHVQPSVVLSYRQNPRANGPITASPGPHDTARNRRADAGPSPYRAGAGTEDSGVRGPDHVKLRSTTAVEDSA